MTVVRTLLYISILSFLSCSDSRKAVVEKKELDFEISKSNDLFLPQEWEVTLWAESPMFYNPTNIDVDIKGRVWVAEAVNYRDFRNKPSEFKHHQEGDRIIILEDTDNDGIADSSRVYVQDKDLVSPMGIAVIGNKVIVSSSPNLIVYTDENGDDVPDKKDIFLSGFGGLDHDHGLHSLVAGPDGKWYFNTGNAGPHIVTDKSGWTLRSGSIYTGGTPYNKENSGKQVSDDNRIWVGGLALRLKPDGSGLKVMAHNFRNAYELALDSYGNMWQNDNDDGVEACRVTWVMENGNAGFFSKDGTRTWKADRRPGQSGFDAQWHQGDPGVMPAGDNTGAGSPTGVVVYESDALGSQYEGMLLSIDAGRNVVFAYQPNMKGAGFELSRKNLISSAPKPNEEYVWSDVIDSDTSKWFRPSDVAVGTDGALFISDWYDPIIGGHQMYDDGGYGRIYRISPKKRKTGKPKIDLSTTEGQIKALLSPAINVRATGFEKLASQGEAVYDQIVALLESEKAFYKARAIWLLSALGTKGIKRVEEILGGEPDPVLRVTAYRSLKSTSRGLLDYARIASGDPSPAVRREVAISLRDVPFDQSWPVIEDLINNFEDDEWYLEALGTAMDGKEEKIFTQLVNKYPEVDKWPQHISDIVWRIHPLNAVDALQERAMLDHLNLSERERMLTALGFIDDLKAINAMMNISKTEDQIGRSAKWWINFKRSNSWHDLRDWSNYTMDVEDVGLQKIIETEVIEVVGENNYTVSEILQLKGDPASGEQISKMYCGPCHQIKENGNNIGPILTNAYKKFDKSTLIDAIIHPNKSILFGYESYIVTTKSNKKYTGFLLSRGETLVLKDLGGNRIVIELDQISNEEVMDKSIMPEPKMLGLSPQNVADISSYLLSLKQ